MNVNTQSIVGKVHSLSMGCCRNLIILNVVEYFTKNTKKSKSSLLNKYDFEVNFSL